MKNKITVLDFKEFKARGTPIVALTAYDYPSAAIIDASGVDFILVGDTLGSVILGHENTLPVSIDDIMAALRPVRRGTRRALLVADLPFGYCHQEAESAAVSASVDFLKAGAEAVKLEGGQKRCSLVKKLVDADIPVMGHLGLTPQAVHAMGGYRVQGKTTRAAQELMDDAAALEDAGIFALVLEGIPEEVAANITKTLSIPTIGIGAGKSCDGQILVFHDLLGLTVPPATGGPIALEGKKPRFVREYLNLRDLIRDAVEHYGEDVREGRFPGPKESYRLSEAERASVETNSR